MKQHRISIRPTLAGILLASLFAFSAPAAAHNWGGMGYGHPACPGYVPGHGMGPHGYGGHSCPHGHGKPYHRAAMAPGLSLGVMVTALPHAALDELGLNYGIRVVKVKPGSAAEAAGITAEDIIPRVRRQTGFLRRPPALVGAQGRRRQAGGDQAAAGRQGDVADRDAGCPACQAEMRGASRTFQQHLIRASVRVPAMKPLPGQLFTPSSKREAGGAG
jgi:hypothetical protein